MRDDPLLLAAEYARRQAKTYEDAGQEGLARPWRHVVHLLTDTEPEEVTAVSSRGRHDDDEDDLLDQAMTSEATHWRHTAAEGLTDDDLRRIQNDAEDYQDTYGQPDWRDHTDMVDERGIVRLLAANQLRLVAAVRQLRAELAASSEAAADVTADKHAAGQPVITLDEDGTVIRHMPDGSIERVTDGE